MDNCVARVTGKGTDKQSAIRICKANYIKHKGEVNATGSHLRNIQKR